MLGLDDEYYEKGRVEGEVAHSPLVEKQFGHKVFAGQTPESIMAGGLKILPEHGVIFLEALKQVTHMTEWSHKKKPRIPILTGGEEFAH